jgi:hypothetical protein
MLFRLVAEKGGVEILLRVFKSEFCETNYPQENIGRYSYTPGWKATK